MLTVYSQIISGIVETLGSSSGKHFSFKFLVSISECGRDRIQVHHVTCCWEVSQSNLTGLLGVLFEMQRVYCFEAFLIFFVVQQFFVCNLLLSVSSLLANWRTKKYLSPFCLLVTDIMASAKRNSHQRNFSRCTASGNRRAMRAKMTRLV